MNNQKALKRGQVNQTETWDLSRLFKTELDYEKALNQVSELTDKFVNNYQTKLTDIIIINQSLDDYRDLTTLISYVATYQSLHLSVDQQNETNLIRSGKFNIFYSDINKKLTFYLSELKMLDEKLLFAASQASKDNQVFLEKLIKELKYKLDPTVEQALSEFNQVLNVPYQNYQKIKLSDLKFNSFEVEGQVYEQSFTLFENGWQTENNPKVRRAAFNNFYQKLGEYENILANNYQTQVLKEKAYANLKGFNSVFDYLLELQDISSDLYHRQIDLIMEHLAKPMRKYAKLLKEIHQLDKMTYADLHLAVDPEFEPNVTVEQSKQASLEGLSILGNEYQEMIKRSFDERWIDFPQNLGKSTGGFCSSPYQKGSYILLNWNNQMNEVFVLAHELGHAGHFYFAAQAQNAFNTRPSMYFIEAPSTMNEIIMANHLKAKSNDLRFKRWVLSSIISKTYYHNCVTHLLEAHYQREVYYLVERKQPITAKVLNELKLNTLRQFWGDVVEIPEYAGRTWIRQPHYFMGLYPYTYSAGLTIATLTYEKIKNNQLSVEKWLDVLRAGGTKNPVDLAKMVDLDLTTDQPLLETIEIISVMIDEIIDLTKQIED